ncbi:phosphate signaling complex PhoU family protein [Kurthia zopfii]|uniref:phosphate signaling complex PhoU family protein n=1 Tax=Kurthia zopfii TaxID=1650 RepID=UPI000F6C0266|nr:PhoU domain-containing protein [Kurthia zopfii]VEI07603.1 Phosphate transport system protein phoU [Kurthia zopfii]
MASSSLVIVSAASDMERIGDHAVNIAKETIRLGNEKLVYSTEKIEHMKALTITMLKDMVDAFTSENLHAAKEISMRDDAVDQLYGEALVSILETAKTEGASLEQLVQISFICKSIERIADYTTNLAEALFFLLKGRHYELNN